MKSRKQQCAVVMGLVLAMCGSAAAEEVFTQMKEVVVTATRDEVPIEQVGSSITVVTAKEIELQQKQTVADVLRMVPGLDVAANETAVRSSDGAGFGNVWFCSSRGGFHADEGGGSHRHP